MVYTSIPDDYICQSYMKCQDGRIMFYFRRKGGTGIEVETLSVSPLHIAQMASLMDFKDVFKIAMPDDKKKGAVTAPLPEKTLREDVEDQQYKYWDSRYDND